MDSTDHEVFWSKVDRTGEHWTWKGKLTPKGYARTMYQGVRRMAHVIAFELQFGPVPEGHDVHHTCRVKHCMRHLKAVDHVLHAKKHHQKSPTCRKCGRPRTQTSHKDRLRCYHCEHENKERRLATSGKH